MCIRDRSRVLQMLRTPMPLLAKVVSIQYGPATAPVSYTHLVNALLVGNAQFIGSLELRNLAKQTADELGIAYKEGVYMGDVYKRQMLDIVGVPYIMDGAAAPLREKYPNHTPRPEDGSYVEINRFATQRKVLNHFLICETM